MRRSLLVVSLLLVAFGAYFTAVAFELPYFQRITPGPGFFPRWVGGLFTVLAALLFVATLRGHEDLENTWPDRSGWVNVGVTVAVLALTILLFDTLGYVLVTALLTLVTMAVLGRHRLPVLVGVSALTSLGTYVLFSTWLRVPLPRGIMWF
ncbi:MAG: tripartite tricarboxylate transporter TctB family protein [Chloroflexota bacterium]|nr:tripartite tricarboxylate transporter TctB family protein [Chloroflexota bacterium]